MQHAGNLHPLEDLPHLRAPAETFGEMAKQIRPWPKQARLQQEKSSATAWREAESTMVKIITSGASEPINMGASGIVDFEELAAPGSDTNFSWFSRGGVDIDLIGTGFVYAGAGDNQNISGGKITSISIDLGNNGEAGAGELAITDTEGLDAAKIEKNDPAAFWNEVLMGNDEFDLRGLSENKIGADQSVIFGDDLRSKFTLTPSGFTDAGGNDVMTGGDNSFKLIGDVHDLEGRAVGNFQLRAVYDAGDDTLTSGTTEHLVTMAGDAAFLGGLATLHAGDDILDNSGSSNDFSFVSGDVDRLISGTLHGGKDSITADRSGTPTATGEVWEFTAGFVFGNRDEITVEVGDGLVAGDVMFVQNGATGTIEGGNDLITAAAGDDTLSGDVLERGSQDVTVTGGNDAISGGFGDDKIFGELQTSQSLAGVAGGNDRLLGNQGNDVIFAQTGDDVLIGGLGNDLLNGGTGRDRASYFTAAEGVAVSLAAAGPQETSGTGTDTLKAIEDLWGSTFADVLTGNSLANVVTGDRGNDELRGREGDDDLLGGRGADSLHGGIGKDALTGGLNADRFVFTALNQSSADSGAADRITDLTLSDLLDLSGIDANGGGAGNGIFERIGNAAAFTEAGQLRLSLQGQDTRLQLNTDDDASAEMTILLAGNHTSAAAENNWLL